MHVDVACLIADVFERGAGGADLKIHVREHAVLRDVETNRDRGWVSVLYFEINVVHPAIEREFRRIHDRSTGLRAIVGEMNHIMPRSFLKTRRVAAKHEDRPLGAVTDQTDSLPDVNGFAGNPFD